jgi:hypothetical protein
MVREAFRGYLEREFGPVTIISENISRQKAPAICTDSI